MTALSLIKRLLVSAIAVGIIPVQHNIPIAAAYDSALPSTLLNHTSSSSSSMSTSLYKIVDDSLYKIVNGTIPNHEVLGKAMGIGVSRVSPHVDETRQANIWDFIATFDSYKTSVSYRNDANGRPTLQNMQYVIVPIWWSDMNTGSSANKMDPDLVVDSFEYNQQYYIDMSWGEMTEGVRYTALDQKLFAVSSVSPDFWNTESSARDLVDSEGLVKNVDYNGICLMYFTSQSGPFSGAGGWGDVNSDAPFFWSTYPGWDDVTRHEVGHNFGHPHHLSVSYEYRNTRPDLGEGTVPYDGYDMMSGGNGFDISHFAAASKWFFNWIPDSSIILMQPEGPTTECPTCLKEGTFTLRPFDDKTLPPTKFRKMGIHIPIVVAGNRLYSYWLSYKTGVNGIAQNGLTVHLSWFDVGGYFGASYDSLNFDAYGDTDTTEDSFVTENTCFHMAPPGYLKDKALIAADLVQPVVCVDSVNPGTNIVVSVSFLDKDNPPPAQVKIGQQIGLECTRGGSSTGTIAFDSIFNNMIHVKDAGNGGEVTLRMCTSSSTISAYFHDDYPHSAISYSSEAAYGSYKSLITSRRCPSKDSFTYKSDFGETYIYLPSSTTRSTVEVEVSCRFTECLTNQYLSNGNCEQCPNNGRSEPGSTSITDCEECPGGTFLPHPQSPQCAVLETYEYITSARKWRVWAPDYDTYSGWVLDVTEIEFYSNLSCSSGSKLNTSNGVPLDSGNAGSGWTPGNAFDGNYWSAWGGRADSDGVFSIGYDFGEAKQVRCIKLYRFDSHYATNVRIQAFKNGQWKNAWIEKDLPGKASFDSNGNKFNKISMNNAPEEPTPSPVTTTQSPTGSSVGGCNDSSFRFKLRKNGRNITRGCDWVANKDTKNRCALGGVAAMCPSTCSTCGSCADSEARFKFRWKGSIIFRDCTWVSNKQTRLRCAVEGMKDTCRSTCGSCSRKKEIFY